MVREYADDLIDRFIDRGECEFVSEFADLLPARVILTLFGLPLDHLDRALAWGRYEGFGTRWAVAREPERGARRASSTSGCSCATAILERVDDPGRRRPLDAIVQRHVEEYGEARPAEPDRRGDEPVHRRHHHDDAPAVEHDEAVHRAPRPAGEGAGDRSLLKRAVEESLRIESPVQMGPRLALKDLEVERRARSPRARSCSWCGARPTATTTSFAGAERFDVERQNVKNHMAFGNGPHFCIGAPLARMEAVTAFERDLRAADQPALRRRQERLRATRRP